MSLDHWRFRQPTILAKNIRHQTQNCLTSLTGVLQQERTVKSHPLLHLSQHKAQGRSTTQGEGGQYPLYIHTEVINHLQQRTGP